MFFIIKFWKEISNIISFLANICVLVITVYTLYLTAFCRKLRFITIGFSMTQFFGESMSISIANKSLHAISITEIFIMKKKDGQFYRITIKKFEDPLIINPWQISNIKMDAYTYILEESGERFDHSDIHMNSVIGINTGTENMVWLKPYKKAPRMQAERAYKKRDYKEFVVIRKSYGDKTLYERVKYVISLKNTDINGNMSWETIFAIPLEKSILLNKTICGYNAINYSGKTSCGKLKKIICKQFGIDSDAIFIEKI